MIEQIISNFGAIDLTEIVGFIAFFFSFISFQFLKQSHMFFVRILSNGLWVVHYIMLGTLNAAVVVFIGVIRTIVSIFWKPELKSYAIIIAIIAAFFACYLYPEEGFIKYLPFFAGFFYGIAEFFKDDFLKCRIIMLLGPISFFIFGVLYGSYAVTLATCYTILSNIVGIIRYLIKKENK